MLDVAARHREQQEFSVCFLLSPSLCPSMLSVLVVGSLFFFLSVQARFSLVSLSKFALFLSFLQLPAELMGRVNSAVQPGTDPVPFDKFASLVKRFKAEVRSLSFIFFHEFVNCVGVDVGHSLFTFLKILGCFCPCFSTGPQPQLGGQAGEPGGLGAVLLPGVGRPPGGRGLRPGAPPQPPGLVAGGEPGGVGVRLEDFPSTPP